MKGRKEVLLKTLPPEYCRTEDQWRIFQWRAFQKTQKILILNDHRHHKMRYFGKFWLNSLNSVPFLLLNPVHGRKKTKLTTDSVVNFVFFETLATEKSATEDLFSH